MSTQVTGCSVGESGATFEQQIEKAVMQARQVHGALTRETTQARARFEEVNAIQEAMIGVRNSWKLDDPGKYGTAYFFLDSKQQRVFVREFLPSEVKLYTEEEWGQLSYDERTWKRSGVPPHYRIVSMKEVRMEACPLCKAPHPCIEEYEQTFDSPDGDEWRKRQLLVCPSELKMVVLSEECRDCRF